MSFVDQDKNYKDCFEKGTLYSTKHAKYFPIYDQLVHDINKKDIAVLEIGVLNGGGLEVWHNLLGEHAKVVGLDFNPECRSLLGNRFSIIIGDQAQKNTWNEIKLNHGMFDLIVDDGGHTVQQQIMSLKYGLDLVSDGGFYVIEDFHANYLTEFGNPSPFSGKSIIDKLVDRLHTRDIVSHNNSDWFENTVFGVCQYSGLVVFIVNRNACQKNGGEVDNGGETLRMSDYRHHSDILARIISKARLYLSNKFQDQKNNKILRWVKDNIFPKIFYIPSLIKNMKFYLSVKWR